MRLQLSTWVEVEAYLQRSRGIIVPIGSCEQHGPTGLIGTDAICPEVIAWQVGKDIDALVAPTLPLGMAQHHMGFPGSITLRPTTLIALVKDVVQSLARHGFERIYFLNGHGGNIPIVQSAFQEVYTELSLNPQSNSKLRCRLGNWFAGRRVMELAQRLYGHQEGQHATPSEVSLTWFAYPDSIKTAKLVPQIAPTDRFYDCEDYRRRFPDGRIGSNPDLATVAHGEQLQVAGVADVIDGYRAFVEAP